MKPRKGLDALTNHPDAVAIRAVLLAHGLTRLYVIAGVDDWAEIGIKGRTATSTVPFQEDAEYLLQACEPLEAAGYRVWAGYLWNTPQLRAQAWGV